MVVLGSPRACSGRVGLPVGLLEVSGRGRLKGLGLPGLLPQIIGRFNFEFFLGYGWPLIIILSPMVWRNICLV